MKRFTLLSFFLLTCNLLFSQVIVDTTKRWNNGLFNENGDELCTEFIRFGSDTIDNSITYKKVLKATGEVSPNWQLYGIIRETPDKKIYYKFDASSPEALLYDFGRQVNDTIIPTAIRSGTCQIPYFYSRPMLVWSIDSIDIGGRLRKQLHIGPISEGETDQWIEGVGSKMGMLKCDFGFVGGNFYRLVCYYENDSLIYLNSGFPYCIVVSDLNQAPSCENSVSVVPNPVLDASMISVHNNKKEPVNLEIISCNGKIIQSLDVYDKIMIYKTNFDPGLYLFKFTFPSGQIKIIKVLMM